MYVSIADAKAKKKKVKKTDIYRAIKRFQMLLYAASFFCLNWYPSTPVLLITISISFGYALIFDNIINF